MTGAGEGLIDHCKKRMRRDPAAGADQGDEYVENQKELFKAKVEKVDRGTLSCKLVGMEIFVLENKGDDEPEFSKAERAKLNEFLHRMAKTDASWRLVDGNVDAAVEDAKSRLNPPPGIKLDHETSQEIQSILHDNSIKPDFFKHAGVPSMDLDKVKAPAYRNTLKNPASVLVNYYPTIPIWSHIVSCIVDTTKVTTNLKHFETHYLEQVNDKLDSIRQVLHRRFPEDEVRDFCFFRIKSLMFGSVIADLELSTRLMKGSALENAVAVEFWSQLPMVSKGKGMVAANQQKICVFLNSIGDQAKHLLEDRMQQEFFTLDHALKRASDVVADESSWLPVVDKNIASQRLILNALEGIDEVEEEEPTVDRQKEKLKLRDQFLQRIQDEFPDHCVSFSGRKPPRLTKPKLPVVAGRFSVILDLTDSDRVKVSSEGQESGEVFGQPTKLPQLCTRLMTCLFEQTLVISPKRKYVFIRANAEVVKAVAELVHTFVERLCVIWDIK
ncbi:hypothetical protein BASA82_001067 [Batrachochytrium salamandrivorans]|nr:hypothetical protein BASA82_001067 [Batrachochytrium salamandrivorans]